MKKIELLSDIEIAVRIGAIAFSVLLLVFAIFVAPFFKMRAYNRLCDGDATYIDALTAELRIDGNCEQ